MTIRPHPDTLTGSMTVCIAALSVPLNAIITVSDTMLSSDIDSKDGAAIKLLPLMSRWACLYAGDPTIVEELRNSIRTALDGAITLPYAAMVAVVEDAYAAMFTHQIDRNILPLFGLTRQQFDEGMRDLGPVPYQQITATIQQHAEYLLDESPTHLLVCGFDDHMHPWIFSTDGMGRCTLQNGYGHHAIGAGATAALAWLKTVVSIGDDVPEIAYHLCEAKFAAETARSAGQETFVVAFTGGGSVDMMTLAPEKSEAIRATWESRRRRPIDKRAMIKLEKGLMSVAESGRAMRKLFKDMRRSTSPTVAGHRD